MSEPSLRAGDVLLYSGTGIFSRLIQMKTWSRYSHVEVYDGYGMSVASRDGIGVGRYPVRTDGLRVSLRPVKKFDVKAAREWFKTVDGQPYDWLGLLSFTVADWQRKFDGNSNAFCSEFATNYLRAGKVDPFNGYPASGIAPGEFLKSNALLVTWRVE